mgnify:CR=1 FL=1
MTIESHTAFGSWWGRWGVFVLFIAAVGGMLLASRGCQNSESNQSEQRRLREYRIEEQRAEHESKMGELQARGLFPCATCGTPGTPYRCHFCGKPCCKDCGSGENGTCPECLAKGKAKP